MGGSERTHTYTGRTCKLHTEGPSRESNLEASCCEATVQTTTSPCSPLCFFSNVSNSVYIQLRIFTNGYETATTVNAVTCTGASDTAITKSGFYQCREKKQCNSFHLLAEMLRFCSCLFKAPLKKIGQLIDSFMSFAKLAAMQTLCHMLHGDKEACEI